jgi:hypothetical protein
VYPALRALVACLLASCALACGARTPLDDVSAAPADGSVTEAVFEVPIGAFAGCALETVEVRERLEAAGGGRGSVTLSLDGEGHVVADLSFDRWLRGTLAFVPTSGATAAVAEGPFDVATVDADFTTPLTVRLSAAALAINGDVLFVDLFGRGGTTKFDGWVHCPVPAGLPRTSVALHAPSTSSIPPGIYAHCTTSSGGFDTSVMTGGDLSLSIAEATGARTATKVEGYPDVCMLAFDDRAQATAALLPGVSCEIGQPCGPPPSLGPSSAPSKATLTGMTGSMQLVDGALFVDVVGDAPPDACGRHFVSLICPTTP